MKIKLKLQKNIAWKLLFIQFSMWPELLQLRQITRPAGQSCRMSKESERERERGEGAQLMLLN